jgi:hypothetical protein
MIDREVFKRDAQFGIAEWPVNARHKGRIVKVGLQAFEDAEVLMAGGRLDDMSLAVLAIADDFGNTPPVTDDDFEIQLRNGKWLRLSVRNTPDRYDPISPTITIYLQSPDK